MEIKQIKKSLPRILVYVSVNLLLMVSFSIFSCTSSVPAIVQEVDTVPGDDNVYPEPEIIKRIKTNTPPLLAEKVIFYDDFRNDMNGWKTRDEIHTHFQLKKGFYFINNAHDSDAAFSTIPVELTAGCNFIIESCIEKIAGKGDCSYGIVWGFDPATGNTHFIILYRDYVLYGRRHSGKWETRINWRKSSFIHKHNQGNKIALKKHSCFFEIFINEQMIFRMNMIENYGENIGFILFGNIMVKADFLLITEYTPPEKNTSNGHDGIQYIVTPGHTYLFENY